MKISSINTYTNYNKNIKQTNRSYFNHIAFGATVIDNFNVKKEEHQIGESILKEIKEAL